MTYLISILTEVNEAFNNVAQPVIDLKLSNQKSIVLTLNLV